MPDYKECFALATGVLLPRVSAAKEEVRDFNKTLARHLGKHYKNCRYIESDEVIISEIKKLADQAKQNKKKVAFVFMSQKGFRGMMEEAISLLQ